MKWYESLKVKMTGFFLLISALFLISIITMFYMMKEKNLAESASKEAALMTNRILQEIMTKQIKAEEIVLSLASVSGLFEKQLLDKSGIIPVLLANNNHKNLAIVSGGVWFEPDSVPIRRDQSVLFFDRSKNSSFIQVKEYAKKVEYRKMAFYQSAKVLKEGEIVWTDVYTDPVTDIRMITVAAPIYQKERFIGVATIDIAIKDNIKQTKNRGEYAEAHSYLMMIDKKGNFIGKSEIIESFTGKTNLFHTENEALKKILRHIKASLESGAKKEKCNTEASIEYITLPNQKERQGEKESSPLQYIQESICIVHDDPVLHQDTILAIYHFPHTHWNVIVGITKAKVLKKYNDLFYDILLITVLMTLLAAIAGFIALQILFIRPLESINKQLTHVISENTLLKCHDKGEIGVLVENLNRRALNLIEAKERETKEYQLRKTQEEMLMQQSKMAVMGEMMDSVAHQWKQPLNALMLYSELIRNDYEEGNIDQAYIEKFRKDIQVQIDHMVNTLDEFRSFFRPNKERRDFSLLEIVNSTLFLAKDDILKNRILVKIEQTEDIVLYGYENEFKHLILNIINNAKDAFIEQNITQRLITIRLISSEDGKRMEIEDNAGGIPEEVIEKVFEANITTKPEGKGTGIGLYMSRQIAQKHHAELTVENRNGGACFIVLFHSFETEELPAR